MVVGEKRDKKQEPRSESQEPRCKMQEGRAEFEKNPIFEKVEFQQDLMSNFLILISCF